MISEENTVSLGDRIRSPTTWTMQGSATDEGQHDFLPGFGCQGTKGRKKVSSLESIIEESPANILEFVTVANWRELLEV